MVCILIGSAGPHFNLATPPPSANGIPTGAAILAGSRISFFFAVFNSVFSWSMVSADYFVYFPATTPRLLVGSMTHIGIFLGAFIMEVIGVGLATGALVKPEWESALAIGPGALMAEAYKPLGGFGKFCAVILALGPS